MKITKQFLCAVYIRLSREDGDKEESDSVANQKKLLTEYVAKHEDLTLYDLYIDDGYSGTNFHRPGFKRMLEDIERGTINCVLVKDLSRFGRDYIDTGRYLERYFPEQKVRFISVADDIDSINQTYDIILPIKNIFNEQYARDISRKIHTTITAKQNAGEFIGAFASYGYKKSPANKNKLIVDDYAASIVRRIFSLYIQGYGKQKIAKILNTEGVLCPSEYKKLNGDNYHNANRLGTASYWSYSTVNSILHKEIYTGNMVQGTRRQQMRTKQKNVPQKDWIIVKETHEPIIDPQTWQTTQALLTKRTTKPAFWQNTNVLAGFVKCGDCGRAMVKNADCRSDGSKTYFLHCGTYKRNGKKYCSPHRISISALENILLEDLFVIIHSVKDLKKIISSASALSSPPANASVKREQNKIWEELKRIKKRKKSLYEDYKDGLISKEEFLAYREDYLKKETLYSSRLPKEPKRKDSPSPDASFGTPWLKKLSDSQKIESLDRAIVAEMLKEIAVYENHEIKITYRFSRPPADSLADSFMKEYP